MFRSIFETSSTKVSKGRGVASENLEKEQKESSIHNCFVLVLMLVQLVLFGLRKM
jgi:hypothetical protein